MLELRPTCEHCNKALLPDSLEARICAYECTFCVACVEDVLGHNICPNCGAALFRDLSDPQRTGKATIISVIIRQVPRLNIAPLISRPMYSCRCHQ
ncbi:MAG: DUF1272 domain-containing protein [Leptolyngbyaceae cyanobacterium]